jgi:SAM-dependent methyltransferase
MAFRLDKLLDLRDGIYANDLVIAAIAQLDFFTWLSANPSSQKQISESLGLAMRPLDVMLTLLSAMDLIARNDHTTEISEGYLVKDSPCFLGSYFASLKDRPGCMELYEVLRTGEPAGWSSRKEGEWDSLMKDDEFATAFTEAMDGRGRVFAPAMAEALPCDGYSSILDIAGGSGVYACSVVEKHEYMRAAVLEKPPVDETARASIARKGFSDRVSVIGSDMFEEALPDGFDIHLWSHVLHDWDEPEVRSLLAKSWEALKPGGMIAIHDAHIDADKAGPLAVARYSVLLMHSTRGKCYSVAELGAFLSESGFHEMRFIETIGNRSLITAKKLQ